MKHKHSVVGLVVMMCGLGAWAQRTNVVVAGGKTVRWPNRTYTNEFDAVIVGNTDSTNWLYLSDGTYVSNVSAVVGAEVTAQQNVLTMTNSAWQLDEALVVGASGSTNQMTMSGSGLSASSVQVGATASATGNRLLVTDSSELVVEGALGVGATNNSGNSVTLTNGATIAAQTVTIADGNDFNLNRDGQLIVQDLDAGQSGFNWNDGGSLVVTGGVLSGVSGLADGSDKTVAVKEDASWNIDGDFILGGRSNDVWVLSEASLVSLGGTFGGSNNNFYMQDTNTVWTSEGAVVLGGISNTIEIANGAQWNSSNVTVGTVGSMGNRLRLLGDGTTWTNLGSLVLGDAGTSNSVVVYNGAKLVSSSARVGGVGAVSNTVEVAGSSASIVLSGGDLEVLGEGSALDVYSTGRVFVGDVAEQGDVSFDGGAIFVASADSNAVMRVSDGARVEADYVQAGVDGAGGGSVSITNNGTLSTYFVGLEEGASLNLNRGGTLEMKSAFDASLDGFQWNDGGTLYVKGGALTGLDVMNNQGTYYTLLDGSDKTLVIGEDGAWSGSRLNAVIGWEGSDNALVVTNGGQVTSKNGYVGFNSSNNTVLVTGTNSEWTLSDSLYVGQDGTISNTVTVRDGGTVSVENLNVASNNVFVLTEDGNLNVVNYTIDAASGLDWQSGILNVEGTLTWDGNMTESGQKLYLLGSDAVWAHDGAPLIVGGTGSSNNLVSLTGGAQLTTLGAQIGATGAADSNRVVVSGTDSLWENTGLLSIGTSTNGGNSVSVSDGGKVETEGLAVQGSENAFDLNDGGILQVTKAFDAATNGFVWAENGSLIVEDTLTNLEQLNHTNHNLVVNGGAIASAGKELRWGNTGGGNNLSLTNGATADTKTLYIGYAATSDDNSITIRDADSKWTTETVNVGYLGSDNTLLVANEGALDSTDGFIGADIGSDNTATVTGTNSTWKLSGNLYVGNVGGGNSLNILHHGLVTNAVATVGNASDGNTASVSGNGSLWKNDTLKIGAHAYITTITRVTNGTDVVETSITKEVDTSDNSVKVASGGRVEARELYIHDGNYFNLNDGGTLHISETNFDISADSHEGLKWNSGGNLSLAGTLLGMDSTNLVIGSLNTNTFDYLDGGKWLTLDGAQASWTTEDLILGYGSGSTALMVSNGSSVAMGNGYIGWSGTGDNQAVVESGASWKSSENLYVGAYRDSNGDLVNAGSGNSLTVSNGGWVLVGDVTQAEMGSSNGLIVASAAGAEMMVQGGADVLVDNYFVVGFNSNRTGRVEISDEGTVTAAQMDIREGSQVFLKDAGTLAITENFNLEQFAQTLVWENGGHLSIGGTFTGLDGLTGTNQQVTITSSTGLWEIAPATTFLVGEEGGKNQLTISDGGRVLSGAAKVGSGTFSDYNWVNVSGSNSLWQVDGTLAIGADQNIGNQVSVYGNGTVEVDALNISTQNYFVLESGGSLIVHNDFDLEADQHQGLEWNSGGMLALDGTLTGTPETNLWNGNALYLAGEKQLTLFSTNGLWDASTNNLIVGYQSGSAFLQVTNGASVQNKDGFVGWGTSGNNQVVVQGSGSRWENERALYIGRYGAADTETYVNTSGKNYLTVSNGGWVTVGTFSTNGLSGGVGVVGTNVIGNASVVATDGFYVGNEADAIGYVSVDAAGLLTTRKLDIRSGSAFDLDGTLLMTDDFNAAQDGFNWNEGATLRITNGALSGLSAVAGTNQTLQVEQAAVWNSGALTVSGDSQTIWVKEDGTANSTSAMIGGSEEDSALKVYVQGSNSTWTVDNDLIVGANGAFSNRLNVTDLGTVDVGGSLNIFNGSVLNMDTSATVQVAADMMISNAYVTGAGTVSFDDSDNTLFIIGTNTVIASDIVFDGQASNDTDVVSITDWEFAVTANTATQFINFETLQLTDATLSSVGDEVSLSAFDSVTMDGGVIAPVGDLYIEGDLTLVNKPTLQVTVYDDGTADYLRVVNALTNGMLQASVDIEDGYQGDMDELSATILIADEGVNDVLSSSNDVSFTERYLLYNFAITNPSLYEVSVVAEAVDGSDLSSMIPYAGLQGVRSTFDSMQNLVAVRTKQLRRNMVATDPTPRSLYNANQAAAPTGAMGPGDKNQIFGMNVWADYYAGQGEYDALGNSDAFSLNSYGTILGFDRLLGDDLILGVNYSYGRSGASADNGDASDTETYWLGGYAEWFNKEGWFADGLLSYGWTDYTSQRIAQDYIGDGGTTGSDVGGHIEGGRYMHLKHWAFAPYAGLNYLNVRADGFTETEEVSGSQFDVSATDAQALNTELGLKIRNRFDTRWGRFQTSGYAEWSYDVINETVSSILHNSGNQFQTSIVDPDPSTVSAGIGISWTADENYEFGVGYDTRINKDYQEHKASVMINVMF